MNSINDLMDSINAIPQIGARGSKKRLSYPIVLHRGENVYYGFMISFYGEDIPDGFALCNSNTGETNFYDNKQISENFSVPIVETILEEASKDPAIDCTDDLLYEYEQAVLQGVLDVDKYNEYLSKVMSTVIPEKRKFYKLFLIGGKK